MSEIWGLPTAYKSGAQNHFFRNLTAILTAYIFGVKHDTHKRASALQTNGSPTSYQNDMNFGAQTASN